MLNYTETKERPAYVRFERVSIEDTAASAREGRYVGRDVDMAHVTPPGSRDIFKIEVPQWLENMQKDLQNQRLPQEWVAQYREAYSRWKAGQEIPLNGTPIKGWGVISPAQQATLTAMMILTVEDLAAINDETMRRIGMGALDLCRKAQAWLAQLHDKGPLTIENANLKQSLETQRGEIETLKAKVAALIAQVKAQPIDTSSSAQGSAAQGEINIDDILTENVLPGKRKK